MARSIAGMVLVSALVLAACGDDDEEVGGNCLSYGTPCSCSGGATGCAPHSDPDICQCPGGDEPNGPTAPEPGPPPDPTPMNEPQPEPGPAGGDCSSYGLPCTCSSGATGCAPHSNSDICQCPEGEEPNRGRRPSAPR